LLKYHVGTLINLKELTELRSSNEICEVMGIGRSFQEALHKALNLYKKEMV
jgi:carbamoylphosphate synthase large subunit